MPLMVACTTSAPLLAMATERSATAEDSEALADTWSMDTAISLMAAEAPAISCAWCSEASARVHSGGLSFLRRRGYLYRCVINGRYQPTHLVDRVVDGVGDSTCEVFGYRGRGGQVTVRPSRRFRRADVKSPFGFVRFVGAFF